VPAENRIGREETADLLKLSDNDFALDPFACARRVAISVTPPNTAPPGAQATYHVYASAKTKKDENVPLGGLSVEAVVPNE
jgi:hypothetical protein